jgi:hypothetical protein
MRPIALEFGINTPTSAVHASLVGDAKKFRGYTHSAVSRSRHRRVLPRLVLRDVFVNMPRDSTYLLRGVREFLRFESTIKARSNVE